MRFQNPPLVELVVELKWASTGGGQLPVGIPAGRPYPIPPQPDHNTFISSFRELAAEAGWSQSERLIPQGLPYMVYQPAMRIQQPGKEDAGVLFQVGPGVFSVHALRPYKSWESFWPKVQIGIDILLKSRSETERYTPFFSANVMYLDVFDENLIGDQSVSGFLKDTLGIGLSFPAIILDQLPRDREIEPQISLKIPLRDQMEMHLNIGGKVTWGDNRGILMNTTVANPNGVAADIKAISLVLEQAHQAIRKTFTGLTQSLHSRMNPVGDSL